MEDKAAELRLDLDYIMHVEYEVPMEGWTKLEEMKEAIVKNFLAHGNESVERRERDVRTSIARTLREQVTTISESAMVQSAPPVAPEPYTVEDLMNG